MAENAVRMFPFSFSFSHVSCVRSLPEYTSFAYLFSTLYLVLI